ncbi:unnamed protein product [Brachionus calyciflorus]|uniref:Uncharacterized protein n=1 Tax=Brachionus calyciflorus TaxID=104777 RepID=A0A814IGW0_9BILA|nr:unnamed protein product [Brachionus calyciflorus]
MLINNQNLITPIPPPNFNHLNQSDRLINGVKRLNDKLVDMDEVIDAVKQVRDDFSDLYERLKKIELNQNTFMKNANDILLQISQDHKKSSVDSTSTSQSFVPTNKWIKEANSLKCDSFNKFNPSLNIINDVASDLYEREKRKNFIIIFGILESKSSNKIEQNEHDKDIVSKIFQSIGYDSKSFIYFNRFKNKVKQSNRASPLRVKLSPDIDRYELIKNCFKLAKTRFSSISISPDLTPAEQLKFKQLKELMIMKNKELNLNKDNEFKYIVDQKLEGLKLMKINNEMINKNKNHVQISRPTQQFNLNKQLQQTHHIKQFNTNQKINKQPLPVNSFNFTSKQNIQNQTKPNSNDESLKSKEDKAKSPVQIFATPNLVVPNLVKEKIQNNSLINGSKNKRKLSKTPLTANLKDSENEYEIENSQNKKKSRSRSSASVSRKQLNISTEFKTPKAQLEAKQNKILSPNRVENSENENL